MKGLAPHLEKLALRIGALTHTPQGDLYRLTPDRLLARYQLLVKEFQRG